MTVKIRRSGRAYDEGERGSITRRNYPELGQETTVRWIAAGPGKGGMFSITHKDILTDTRVQRTTVESRGHGTMRFPELPEEIFDLS